MCLFTVKESDFDLKCNLKKNTLRCAITILKKNV